MTPGMTRATQIGGTHYASKTIQPWDVLESWQSPEAFIGFLEGNALKYLSRWRQKGGVQDLAKCQHYLAKLIEVASQQEQA